MVTQIIEGEKVVASVKLMSRLQWPSWGHSGRGVPHTLFIPFVFQFQVWHENTENTVSRLARSSEEVADQLDISSQRQEEMIEKQNISLEQQEEILKNEGKLWEAVQASARDLEDVFDEMKQNTKVPQGIFVLFVVGFS